MTLPTCIRVVKVQKLKTPEERATVTYVGRRFAGWDGSRWGNPFLPSRELPHKEAVQACLEQYRKKIFGQNWAILVADMDALWAACEHGEKPLGCWCIDAETGDGQLVVCHAQVLADILFQRYCRPEAEAVPDEISHIHAHVLGGEG